jgi:hypothetical protein
LYGVTIKNYPLKLKAKLLKKMVYANGQPIKLAEKFDIRKRIELAFL